RSISATGSRRSYTRSTPVTGARSASTCPGNRQPGSTRSGCEPAAAWSSSAATARRSPAWTVRRSRSRRRDFEPEPRCQVVELGLDPLRDAAREPHVLVDRVHSQDGGLAVGGGVELADQAFAVEDREREVAPAALGGGLV